ncbi:hypothetical protein EON63_11505 [archaeon]|nr:MAG: hypothetical protein EON63_11505 [archaeon]
MLVTPRLRPHDIRYLSLYDNRYLGIFQGHTEYITSLSMCPVNDTFLTASEDHTIRRWDIQSGKQTMHITLPSAYNSPMVSLHYRYDIIYYHTPYTMHHIPYAR